MKPCAGTLPAPGMAVPLPLSSPPAPALGPVAWPRGAEQTTREVSGPVAGRPASARASRLADEFARVLQGQGDGKDAAPLRGADVQEAARSPKAAHADDAADTADIADAADIAELADVDGVAAAGALAWPPALPVFGVALVPPPPPPQLPSSSAAAAPAGSAALAAVAARAASADAVSASAEPGAVAAAKPTTVARPDGGEAWELSITEPDGLVLTLRAERVGASASATAATPPAWSLAINAPAAEAAALQRHAPRLAERLAARALAPAHLRIASRHEARGD